MPAPIQGALVLFTVLVLSTLVPLFLLALVVLLSPELTPWLRLLMGLVLLLFFVMASVPLLALGYLAVVGLLNRSRWGWWLLVGLLGFFALIRGFGVLIQSVEGQSAFGLFFALVHVSLAVPTIALLLMPKARAWFKREAPAAPVVA